MNYPTVKQVSPEDRAAWMQRPRHQSTMGLYEWLDNRHGKPTPTAIPQKSNSRPIHTAGEMNGIEKRYAVYLDIQKIVGEIISWKFEPIKLRLAKATFYQPDFLVVMPNHRIELRETKGFWEDDARVKIKVAAEMFPEFSFVAVTWDKRNKIWKTERFANG